MFLKGHTYPYIIHKLWERIVIMRYKPRGICASAIDVEMDGNIIRSVKFTGGCDGNHKGLCALVEGMDAQEAVKRLKGITCGFRDTSCPDQLAVCLEQLLQNA